MMKLSSSDRVRKILDSGRRLSVYISGSNSSMISWLTLEPGASKAILELRNAYSYGAAGTLLSKEPTSWVSEVVSQEFARSAFLNSLKYDFKEAKGNIFDLRSDKLIGVGVTGSIRTSREKKGDHKAYISIMDSEQIVSFRIKLSKGERSRLEEDEFLSTNTLDLINMFIEKKIKSDFAKDLEIRGFTPGDELEYLNEANTLEAMSQLLGKEIDSILFLPDGRVHYNLTLSDYALFSGSFNPVHAGHISFCERVSKLLDIKLEKIIYEISLDNVDKGVSDPKLIVQTRVKELLQKGIPCMLTTKPSFVKKCELITDGLFLMGADTFVRLLDKKYYNDSAEEMFCALSEFKKSNNRIIVAPRFDSKTEKLVTLEDVEIPAILKGRVEGLSDFRMDISSTELRKKMGIQ